MSRSDVRPYPELSVPAVVFGTLQGIVMTASFVYIALKLGFGLAGSTVAAIMGFVVLRGILRRRSIVENNVNQTVASGINTASSGVVFTLPALMLLSVGDPELADIPVGPLIVAAIAGSRQAKWDPISGQEAQTHQPVRQVLVEHSRANANAAEAGRQGAAADRQPLRRERA